VRLARFAIASGCSPRAALWASLAYGTGSLFFVYAAVYSRQVLASTMVYLVLLTHIEGGLSTPRRRFVAGLVLGFAIATDYAVVFLVALALWFILRHATRRERAWLVSGTSLIVLGIAAYHWALLGSPFTTPYSARVWIHHPMYGRYKGEVHQGGEFQRGALLGLRYPRFKSLYGLTFSPFRGVFLFCPALVAGAYGHWKGARPELRRIGQLALAAFVVYLLFVSSLGHELYWSGFPLFFGPRYLLPLFPLALFGIARLDWTGWPRLLTLVAIAVSMLINVLGAMFHYLQIPRDADDPALQAPIALAASELGQRGLRIPVLDVLGVSSAPQAIVFVVYAVALAAAIWALNRRLGLRHAS
jgi:hypothetical protein